jgi:lysine-N-methylase
MKRTCLTADYLQKFQCTGSACEDTCCQGWSVNIDKRTFAKYKKIRDKHWKKKLTKHIRRNKYETTFSSYATIKMGESGFCPFLNKDRLCSVQLELGSTYLSKTCASYPRQLNKVYDTYEWSGAVSCPEIARLALLDPAGISFSHTGMEVDENPLLDKLMEEEGFYDSFPALRSWIMELLKNRTVPLEARVLLLGLFIQELEQAALSDDDKQICQTIHFWRTTMAEKKWPAHMASFPVDPKQQLEILSSIVDHYVSSIHMPNARYLQCYREFQAGVGSSCDRYQSSWERYYTPFVREHEYILENYLVHYVFTQLFPFSLLGETLYADYVVLVLRFALIRMHLIGLAAYHRGLTPELAITLIQSFSRTFEHDLKFFTSALRLLRDEGYDSLACMSILIQNENIRG